MASFRQKDCEGSTNARGRSAYENSHDLLWAFWVLVGDDDILIFAFRSLNVGNSFIPKEAFALYVVGQFEFRRKEF